MKNLFLCLSVLLLVSCGSKTDFEIKGKNGKLNLTVQTDGNIIVNNEINGNISNDGTVTDKNGKIIAKMEENNILLNSKGEVLIKIDKNGRMDNGSGIFIEWSKDGELIKGNENTGMKISPVKNKSFRNASIILFLYLNFGK